MASFEKMLYDQGQLLQVFGKALRLDAAGQSKTIAQQAIYDIAAYIRDNLSDNVERGGFFSAEDADSLPTADADTKREGAFAVWTWKEINDILSSPLHAALFISHYGVREEGNVPVEYDHHGELRHQNVLMEQRAVEETAALFHISPEEGVARLQACLNALRIARRQRPKPLLDDKILVSWNALAISGFCQAYMATLDASLLAMAQTTADFIRKEMVVDGQLQRVYRGGPALLPAMAVDYAYLIRALLDLWTVTLQRQHLDWALVLQQQAVTLFWDHQTAGFFSTAATAADLLLRLKDLHDGAEPAVNSVMAGNLLQLHLITNDANFRSMLDSLTSVFASDLKSAPFARPAFLGVLVEDLMVQTKVTFLLPAFMRDDPMRHPEVVRFKAVADELPSKVFAVEASEADHVQVVVCRGNVCLAPAASPAELKRLLQANNG